jgi:hypothetical protein
MSFIGSSFRSSFIGIDNNVSDLASNASKSEDTINHHQLSATISIS